MASATVADETGETCPLCGSPAIHSPESTFEYGCDRCGVVWNE